MGLRLSAFSPRSVLLGLAIVLTSATCALSQIPSWTDLSPSAVDSQRGGAYGTQYQFNGNYGTEYQFNAANYPGAREGSVSFTDLQGRLWLFGGYGYDSTQDRGDLNDLWVFDPTQGTQGEWAWMGGSSTLGTPCSTVGFAAGFPVTCNGQLGSDVTEYQFDPANFPGGRQNEASWVDPQGRLWLYGGVGYDTADNYQNDLDDLWVFDPSQGTYGEWAWMGGSNTGGQNPTYGTEFQFNAANIPGDREGAVTWTVNGKFWLFGGQLGPNTFNDLWVFDPSQGANGEWAWMGGSNTVQPSLLTSARATFWWVTEFQALTAQNTSMVRRTHQDPAPAPVPGPTAKAGFGYSAAHHTTTLVKRAF